METGRLLGLQGVSDCGCPAGGVGALREGKRLEGGLGWKEVASALDGLGWEAVDLGTSPEDLRGCVCRNGSITSEGRPCPAAPETISLPSCPAAWNTEVYPEGGRLILLILPPLKQNLT